MPYSDGRNRPTDENTLRRWSQLSAHHDWVESLIEIWRPMLPPAFLELYDEECRRYMEERAK